MSRVTVSKFTLSSSELFKSVEFLHVLEDFKVHSLGSFGCRHILSTLIINDTCECIFIHLDIRYCIK